MKTIPFREKLQASVMSFWNIFNRKNGAEKG